MGSEMTAAAVGGHGQLFIVSAPSGTGKTTLVQGIARGLGITDPITSPTFVVERRHACPGGEQSLGPDGAEASARPGHHRGDQQHADHDEITGEHQPTALRDFTERLHT